MWNHGRRICVGVIKGNFTTNYCFRLCVGRRPKSILTYAYIHSNKFEISTLDDAMNMFNEMIQTHPLPSLVNFTKLLDVVTTKLKHFSCTIRFFKQMCELGVPIYNKQTFNIVIRCYSKCYCTDQGFTVLGFCFKHGGVIPDVSVYNTIINGFIYEDHTHEAEKLFNKLFNNNFRFCEPNLVTYNTMIKGFCKIGNNFTAISLLKLMDGRGCKPNVVSYNTIIDSLCKDINIDYAFKLFKQMVFRIPPNIDTYNSFIYALSNSGHWDIVSTFLNLINGIRAPNKKTFNIIVDALCKQGNLIKALDLLIFMLESGTYPPDIHTYNSLINACCLKEEISTAWKLLEVMDSSGVKPNIATYNTLFYFYCCNHLSEDKFRYKFNRRTLLPKFNRITLYLMFWETKLDKQVEFPNEHIYKDRLEDICEIDRVEEALDLFHFMDSGTNKKLNSDIDVYNILIDGAMRCGKFDTARRFFHDLVVVRGLRPDANTYKVMIRGLCLGGLLKDAKQLFLKMEKTDYPPDSLIINDIIDGYMENKPFDDVVMLLRELETRGHIPKERVAASTTNIFALAMD